ncbi:MAG: hypothetical protein QN114_10285, partial [Armatimonadota bacterium]|nr:hypothetical protein [Armatimonadota bacterium]
KGFSGAGLWRATAAALSVLLVLPAAAPATFPEQGMIVPSRRIGPYHLGMSVSDVVAAHRAAPCPVQVSFSGGRASRLETNCGGAYRTEERVQVGESPGRMLTAYGDPQRRMASDFAGVRGEWLYYTRAGIAFRVVYGATPDSALIQAIAVFPGTGPQPVQRIPPPPAPPGAPGDIGQ